MISSSALMLMNTAIPQSMDAALNYSCGFFFKKHGSEIFLHVKM